MTNTNPPHATPAPADHSHGGSRSTSQTSTPRTGSMAATREPSGAKVQEKATGGSSAFTRPVAGSRKRTRSVMNRGRSSVSPNFRPARASHWRQNGSLGPSMRAKTPIRNASGKIIGLVSVGISEQKISETLRANLLIYLLPAILGLGLGVTGAVLLSRRVKRQTYGLEPGEIAGLLEQREAMLHGVREGAVTVDTSERITMVNDEAQRLLGVDRQLRGP